MRIVPFPGATTASQDEAWCVALEAALTGSASGPTADSWRELREDVRALAPPMTPEFQRHLHEEIVRRSARARVNPISAPGGMGIHDTRRSARSTTPASQIGPIDTAGPSGVPKVSGRLGWILRSGRYRVPALAGTICVVIAAVVVAAAPWRTRTATEALPQPAPQSVGSARLDAGSSAGASRSSTATAKGTSATTNGARASSNGASASGAFLPVSPTPGGPAAAPGRVQELAASISLSATPQDVQATADRVARLAVSGEGFVESSHVQVQHEGASEATLMLRLPSRRLNADLASLGRLAPVRAESQSLQDITNTYDAARQRVGDATAERRALLRALAKATTEGQVDSLRARLSQARLAIAQAQAALHAVSQRASTAEVEVTVLGDAHAGSEGLTFHRGLHDASRVLLIMLIGLILAAAVLVPLALLLAALAGARRVLRRYQRERVLDAR